MKNLLKEHKDMAWTQGDDGSSLRANSMLEFPHKLAPNPTKNRQT